MASPPLLDFDALIAPIPGDAPAGQPLPFDVRHKLEDLRKEINPDDYDADDPRRPTQLRKPDWAGIVQLASNTLASTSKDLLVAARLTEALTFENGFAGLRDGLDLLGRLAAQCWDRLYPLISDGESLDVREGPFKWLNEARSGALFPNTLRSTPLVTVRGTGYGLADWQAPERRPAFENAVADMSPEAAQDLVDDLKSAREKLNSLAQVLQDKMAEFAPDLNSSENSENLGTALNDCLKVANQILQRKSGGPATTETADGAPTQGATVSTSLSSRADAYRMLNQAADMLQRLEPHSPIPYLIKRAVRLGELRFPELMRALIRENAVLDELDRLIGVEAPPPPPT